MKGKRLGNVVITAKAGKKKYKCKVRVSSNIDASKIKMAYANDVFTKEIYGQLKEITYGEGNKVMDKKALKAIYSRLCCLKLTAETYVEPTNLEEVRTGGDVLRLYIKNGKYIEIFSYSTFEILVDGNLYQYEMTANDISVMTEIRKLVKDNKEW